MKELGVAAELLAVFCFLRAVTAVWALGHQRLYVSTEIKIVLAGKGTAEHNSTPSLLVFVCADMPLSERNYPRRRLHSCPKWDMGDVPFSQSAETAFSYAGLYI